MNVFEKSDLGELWRPEADSHKGQNGKVLVIGGSELFHASIFWSADVASRLADLVYFASPANENNEVVRKRIKEGFWNGIVVDWGQIDEYMAEAESVLIGPGMPREDGLGEREIETEKVVDGLLKKYPDKRWVVDGGALQEVNPKLLNGRMIITPHLKEWERLLEKNQKSKIKNQNDILKSKNYSEVGAVVEFVSEISGEFGGVTILLKNVEGKDVVVRGEESVVVEGGNEGLSKGGTGDVLAGLTAGFYAKNESVLSAAAASFVVKKAGDALKEERGVYYNASDLVSKVGVVLGSSIVDRRS